jgi:uncharacterized protein YndB with AHSA1/START domain
MTQPTGRSTRVSQIIKAPREVVFQAFLEPDALASWLLPDGMSGHLHTFNPHEGGKLRMSLTYQNPDDSTGGKTSADTDTFEAAVCRTAP